jgi:hypothetical protein
MIFNGTTVAFSTRANVWKTRYSFTPSCYMTMDNDFLSSNRMGAMTNEILYKHDVNYTYNSFYGDVSVPSTIEVVSNQNPSAVKIFKALSLETDAKVWNGSVYTNKTRDSYAYQEGALNPFVQKEGNQYVDMPRSATNSSSNITFVGTINIDGFDSQEIVDKLAQKNIILAVREIMETKIIRVSPHFFNTDSEMLQVIDEIKKL